MANRMRYFASKQSHTLMSSGTLKKASSSRSNTRITGFLAENRRPATWDPDDVHELPHRQLTPARVIPRGRTKHVPRRAYCETVGGALMVESALEHHHLRTFDRNPAITWIVAQPVRMRFRVNGNLRTYTPDFLVEHAAGSVGLREVKRAEEAADPDTQAKFDAIADACAELGWDFAMLNEPDPCFARNLIFLEVFRRATPWHDEVMLELAVCMTQPISIGELLHSVDDETYALPVLWRLLWSGQVRTELSRPLTLDSLLTWNVEFGL